MDIPDSRKDSSQYSTKQTKMRSSGKKKNKGINSLKIFVVALTFSFVCKTLAGIVMKSSITQIERRFGTTSSEAGLIDGSFEIGNLLMITLVSHFGTKSHIPRLIGTGCFIMGTGSILTALPHFFMGYYRYDSALNAKPLDNSTETYTPCSTDVSSSGHNRSSILVQSSCKNESGSFMWIYVIMGNTLRGIGETPIAPLGITYIDNFAKEGQSTFYIGIIHSVTMVGPLIGYLLGSLCAKLYVDIGYIDLSTITIEPTDSRWVGAWWLGFLIAGILSIVSGVPFFFFPKHLKEKRSQSTGPTLLDGSSTNDNRDQKVIFRNPEKTKKPKGLAGFFYSLKCILSNKIYLIYLLSSTLTSCSFIGIITYMPKYLEQAFDISMSKSNLFLGTIVMPVFAVSVFLGGYISKKFKLTTFGILKLLIISRVSSSLFQALFYFLTCDDHLIAGLTVTYNGNAEETSQITPFSSCNSDCNCNANLWDPVCGDDGLTYMSPCLAGCKSLVGHGKDTVFYNCSCVEVSNFQLRKNSAHLGVCSRKDDCSRIFIYYVILTSLVSILVGIGTSSSIILIFKFVEPDLKSLSIGLYTFVMRTVGGLLTPIYVGAMIDTACLKWDTSNCGNKGACRIYESVSFRNTFLGLTSGLRISDCVLYIFLFTVVKKANKENNNGLSNNRMDVDESNLKELLKNNKQMVSSAHVDSESYL